MPTYFIKATIYLQVIISPFKFVIQIFLYGIFSFLQFHLPGEYIVNNFLKLSNIPAGLCLWFIVNNVEF